MTNLIFKTENNVEAVIRLDLESVHIKSEDNDLLNHLKTILESVYSGKLNYYYEPNIGEIQKSKGIIIRSKIVEPKDKEFPRAVIQKLRAIFPRAYVMEKVEESRGSRLRGQLRSKLANMPTNKGERKIIEEIFSNLYRLDEKQTIELLSDLK